MNGNLFGSPVKDEYQLFHMTEDPEEKCNLIAETKYTSLVNEFKAKLARILQDREGLCERRTTLPSTIRTHRCHSKERSIV